MSIVQKNYVPPRAYTVWKHLDAS